MDTSYSSDQESDLDLPDTSGLRSHDTSQSSSVSTPGSQDSSTSSNSPGGKKIYPDLSKCQSAQTFNLATVDGKETSTSKSKDSNNSSSKDSKAKQSAPSNSTEFYNFIIIGMVFVIAAFIIYMVIPGPSESSPALLSFKKYVNDIDDLSQRWPNQKKRLWTTIKASARHILNETVSDYPSVILMASHIDAGDTALCLARLITSKFEFASRKSHYSSVADIAELKHLPSVEQKKALDEKLRLLLRQHKSVVVNNLQLLSAEAALLLHAYCDNDNAPFKDVMIVLIFYTNDDIPLDPNRPNSFEAYLEERWSRELHIDKVSAIMSRVANNIVVVTKESKAAIESVCSKV